MPNDSEPMRFQKTKMTKRLPWRGEIPFQDKPLLIKLMINEEFKEDL